MANLSQRIALQRAGSVKGIDTIAKPAPGPSLLSANKSGLLKLGGSSKNVDANLELLEASEHYQGEIAELSAEPNCFHCKDQPASGDSHCHICGHTACVRCAKLYHISERYRRKKDDVLARVCFDCKDMLLGKPKEGKKEIAPPVWEVADAYLNCFLCHVAFTKGHQYNCGTCGELFCSTCISKRTDVPAYFKHKVKSKALRVCDRCRFDIIGGATFTDNHQKVREGIESASMGNIECLPLQLVLTVPQYAATLREFLAQNHALENLNFLAAVDIYRAFGKQDPALFSSLAKQIYQEFLIPTANQLVNLPAVVRDSIEKAVTANQMKLNLFDAAVTAVIAMVEKDVYRRFAATQESKNMLRESDAATFAHYLHSRHRRMSFSILQRKEDVAFLDAIMAALNFQKLLKTVRKGLAWYTDSIEGSHLVAYLHKEKYASSRPGAIAVAQRLVEFGYLSHTLDPTLDFADTDHPSNIYQAIDGAALAKKFPSISSLFKMRENVFGYLLQRGISYCRLWGAVSVEHMKLFLWHKEDGLLAHSALNLKGASVVFESGGEEDEDESGGFAGGVKDSLGGKDAALRHGQVYLKITIPRDKAVLAHLPDVPTSAELVYLLEEPSLRSRWRKCFEKECKLPVKMVYTTGISKRAAFVANAPTVIKRADPKENKEREDSGSKTTADICSRKVESAPSTPKTSTLIQSPNDRFFMANSSMKKGLPVEEDTPPPPPRSSPSRPPVRNTPPPPVLDAPPPPPPSPAPAPPPLPPQSPPKTAVPAPRLPESPVPYFPESPAPHLPESPPPYLPESAPEPFASQAHSESLVLPLSGMEAPSLPRPVIGDGAAKPPRPPRNQKPTSPS